MAYTLEQTTERLKAFEARIKEMWQAAYGSTPNIMPVWSQKEGKKFIKIVADTSAFAFIEVETGNIYKAASWAAPAKHARGNIFNDDPAQGCTAYGPNYIR